MIFRQLVRSTSFVQKFDSRGTVESIGCLQKSYGWLVNDKLRRTFCASTTDTASLSSPPTAITTTTDDQHPNVISSTVNWFRKVVLDQKLCPFASPFASNNKLRIIASPASTPEQAAADVTREALSLMRDGTSNHETTLVVFHDDFVKDFLDFVRLSWTLQEKAIVDKGLQGELQLVLFHPHATHQTYGQCEESPADYTIRSPYPTVHLLREEDVVRAVTSGYPNLEELPTRNKDRLSAQGLETCQRRLAECYVEK